MTNQQADKLRFLASESPADKKHIELKPRTIVIASGKGGVGKTTLAVNLAVALSDLGLGCGLIDADLGLADAHMLFGHRPTGNLSEIVKKNIDPAQVLNRLPDGPWILPGLNGDLGMASLSSSGRSKLLAAFSGLGHPMGVILLDAAAGAGPDITDFALWADELLLVVAPEPTSILDAYGLLKIYKNRGGKGPVGIVINRLTPHESHPAIFGALRSTAQGFLGMDIEDLGAVPDDPNAKQALTARRPLLRVKPQAPASRAIRAIAERIRNRLPHTLSPEFPKTIHPSNRNSSRTRLF